MASRHPKTPAHTTVFLVRHGQTPSTGKVLPGRAPGLNLASVGVEQANAAAARLAELPKPPVQQSPSTFRFPSGESFSEMATRSFDTVVELARQHRGEAIVLVSHADPIKAILSAAAGAPLDSFQRLVISPCSVSTLVLGESGAVVLNMNTTGSLKELSLS